MRKLLGLALLLAAVVAVPAWASWGVGGCGPVGSPAFLPMMQPAYQPAYQPKIVEYPRYVWKAVPGDESQMALFEYGKQLGNYSFLTGKFRCLLPGDLWADATLPAGVTAPPAKAQKTRDCVKGCGCDQCAGDCQCGSGPTCSIACRCVLSGTQTFPKGNVVGDMPLTGVVSDKIRHGVTTYCGPHGCLPISTQQAYQALLGVEGSLTDDSKLMRLTCIGTDAECSALLNDWNSHPALTPYKGKLLVQSYRPDQGRVANAGFKTDGHPSIYLQAPNGEVLHRQDGYRGPGKLAEAIRKADPNYDPNKDPDLNKPAPKPTPDPLPGPMGSVPWYVYAGLGLLALVALKK